MKNINFYDILMIMIVAQNIVVVSSFQHGSFLPSLLKNASRRVGVSMFNQQGINTIVRPLIKFHTTISRNNQNHHQATKSSDSNNNLADDEFTFEVQSLDRQGQWMNIDYNKIPIEKLQYNNKHSQDNKNNNSNKLQNVFAPIQPSPIETKLINDKIIYIKRDDLLHLRNSNVSGNKARKMLALNELSVDDFPDVVVSYGGPQSNAMVALAAIVQSKNNMHLRDYGEDNSNGVGLNENNIDEIESDGWIMKDDQKDDYHDDDNDDDNENDLLLNNASNSNRFGKKRFIYYTKKLPRYLRNQPNGNLLRALTLGMEMVQLKPDTYNKLFGGYEGGSAFAPIDAPVEGSSLWVPQGGACGLATQGAKYMAEEILSFWVDNGKGRPLSVCVPGGTCTTAMLLSRELNSKIRKVINDDDDSGNMDIEVVVIPCVGDEDYASRQMRALDRSLGGNGKNDIPRIMKPIKRKRYFRFGEPNAAILETYHEMRNEHGLFLDLLYGAPAWNVLLENLDLDYNENDGEKSNSPIQGRQVMYVHSGGLEGVSSQLKRYKHQGLVDSTEVQN